MRRLPFSALILALAMGALVVPSAQARDRLGEVAAKNGMSRDRLVALMESDETVFVDESGKLGYIEPVADEEPPPDVAQAAPYPLGDTFALHSRPGSDRTIYLDFDGADLTGSAWDDWADFPSNNATPYDLDGTPGSFSEAEKEAVQLIWQEVAEDYAPFAVDVTTQAPDPTDLKRSSPDDTRFGATAVITSNPAYADFCRCSGIAYIDVFDMVGSQHEYYQPALVFPHGVSHVTHWIAQTTAHEVGHNLGLAHDGTSSVEYYQGVSNGLWAPIMGSSFENPVSQWSKGEYAGANNQQDDFAVMRANGLPARPDEAGSSTASAVSLDALGPDGAGVVSSAADADWFSVTCPAGATLTASATGAPRGSDLDVQLRIRDAGGAVLATANPEAGRVSNLVATGLDASASYVTDAGGTYFLDVDGVGAGTWGSGGYSDYGSTGQYVLSATGCTAPATDVPTAPTGLTATPNNSNGSVTLSWSPPLSNGGAAISGYKVQVDTNPEVTVTSTSYVAQGLSLGSHTFSVRAFNDNGTGPATTTSASVSQQTPGMPASLSATADQSAGSVRLDWTAPTDVGGSAVTGYQLSIDGGTPFSVGNVLTTTVSGLSRTTHTFVIRAVNSFGAGTPRSVEATLTIVAPSAPASLTAVPNHSAGSVKLTWSTPTSTGGSPVTGYQVSVDGGTPFSVGKVITWTVDGLSRAPHTFAVQAVNAVGAGDARTVKATLDPEAPGSPASLSARVDQASGNVTLLWTPPTSDGGSPITGYRLTVDGIGTSLGNVLTHTVSGLSRATHTFTVAAVTAGGAGSAKTVTATIDALRAPAAPGGVRAASGARGGRTTATVRWQPPADLGGPAVTGYRVLALKLSGTRVVKRKQSAVLSASTLKLSMRLPAGRWKFQVRASNAAGWGAYSTPSRRVIAR